jgi:hypothetical protein
MLFCIGLYLLCKNPVILSITTLNCFTLFHGSHNPPILQSPHPKKKTLKKTLLIQLFSGLVTLTQWPSKENTIHFFGFFLLVACLQRITIITMTKMNMDFIIWQIGKLKYLNELGKIIEQMIFHLKQVSMKYYL